MSDIPPGMQNGLLVSGHKDGKLRIALVSDGQERGHFDANPDIAGGLAFQVLQAAKMLHDTSGKALDDRTQVDGKTFFIDSSAIGLAPSSQPGNEAIVFRCGDAEIGFNILRSKLPELANAMLALSADSGNPQ